MGWMCVQTPPPAPQQPVGVENSSNDDTKKDEKTAIAEYGEEIPL